MRVLSRGFHDLIHRVEEPVQEIYKIGSMSPGSILLMASQVDTVLRRGACTGDIQDWLHDSRLHPSHGLSGRYCVGEPVQEIYKIGSMSPGSILLMASQVDTA